MNLRDLSPWSAKRNLQDVEGHGTGYLSLQREINRMFDDFFQGVDVSPLGQISNGGLKPSLDVSETDKTYTVSVELPGIEAKDVDIAVAGGMLTIKGEKKSEKEEKDKHYHRVERSFGSFERSLALPADAKEEKIKASFKNGVLELEIPKAPGAQSKVKKIAVKAA